ncbi:MAG: fluoride efflux transporter CrcB [Candidatus Latescibacteria bacterium]|nr:fluoride efflux transporter CrcB [Candidatus Latescibacterota bacterium]
MIKLLLIGSGGFIGSVGRYLVSRGMQSLFMELSLPIGTLSVNVIGCLLAGLLGGLLETRFTLTSEMQLFFFVGILGGFTTFSAFGYETYNLLRTTHPLVAGANMLAQIGLGIGAVCLGHWLARIF